MVDLWQVYMETRVQRQMFPLNFEFSQTSTNVSITHVKRGKRGYVPFSNVSLPLRPLPLPLPYQSVNYPYYSRWHI